MSAALTSGLSSARLPLLLTTSLLSLLLSFLSAAVLSRWRLRHAVATLLVAAVLADLLRCSSAAVYFGLELVAGPLALPLLRSVAFWIGNTANAFSVWLPALLAIFAIGSARLGASAGRGGPWSPLRAQVAAGAVCAALSGVYVGEVVLPSLAGPNGTESASGRQLDAAIAVADVLVARVTPCLLAGFAGVRLLLLLLRERCHASTAPDTRLSAPGVEALQMEAPGVQEASLDDVGFEAAPLEAPGSAEETRLSSAEADEDDAALAEWRHLRQDLCSLCLALVTIDIGVEMPLAGVGLAQRLGASGVDAAVDLLVMMSYLRGAALFVLAVVMVAKFRSTARRVLCPCCPDPGYANVVPVPLDEE